MKTLYDALVAALHEQVSYYSADPSRRCPGEYVTPDGRRCMLGRFMPIDYERLSCCPAAEIVFTPPYNRFPISIHTMITFLHDQDWHWDSNGLNEDGQRYVEKILTSSSAVAMKDVPYEEPEEEDEEEDDEETTAPERLVACHA